MKATLAPVPAPGWFDPRRGFAFEPDSFSQTAGSLREAVRLGFDKTLDSTLAVFKMIRAMGSGRVSTRFSAGRD